MANHAGVPSFAPHAHQLYGTLHGDPLYGRGVHCAKKMGRSSNVSFPAVCLSLFVPWLLFCAMSAVVGFSIHYTNKGLCYLCVISGLLATIATGKLALDSVKKKQSDPQSDPTWLIFLAATSGIAWALGVICGDLNFYYNMEPFYEISGLNDYTSIDPARMPGQQIMDAAYVTFVAGSKLDTGKAMAFHNWETYCVTPIVNGNVKEPIRSYDYWAVGMNCCTGMSGSFGCGEFNNKAAMSGLRVMRDDLRNFYRLAVKQAESAYAIKANHPIFLHWMQDPQLEIAAYQDEGFKYFCLGAFGFFALMLFLVIVSLVLFS